MLTTRNEFETIPAFEVITGSSQGGYTSREIACDLINAVDLVTCHIETILDWKVLATCDDDDMAIEGIISDYIDHLNYYAPIPASCSIGWQDNEIIVLPYLDDEIPRLENVPDNGARALIHGRSLEAADVIYVVNDHGNVTCWQWNPNNVENDTTGGYESIWDMV